MANKRIEVSPARQRALAENESYEQGALREREERDANASRRKSFEDEFDASSASYVPSDTSEKSRSEISAMDKAQLHEYNNRLVTEGYRRRDFDKSNERDRSSYVNKQESAFAFDEKEKEKESEATYIENVNYLIANRSKEEVMLQLNSIQAHKNMKENTTSWVEQLHLLASRNPDDVKQAMDSSEFIERNLYANGGTSAGVQVLQARSALVSMESIEESASIFKTEAEADKALESGTIKGYGKDQTGKIIGIPNVKESAVAVAKEHPVLNPKNFARAKSLQAYKNAGVDLTGDEDAFTGVVTSETAPFKSKRLSSATSKAFEEVRDMGELSLLQKNNLIFDIAMEETGITTELPPSEYHMYSTQVANQTLYLNDIEGNALAAADHSRTVEGATRAYDYIVATTDTFLQGQAINPAGTETMLSKSLGTADAISVASQVGLAGERGIFARLDASTMQKHWDETSPEKRYTSFALAVVDALWDSTSNLDTNEQANSLKILTELRDKIHQGKLSDEPLLASMFGSMYNNFVNTTGATYDSEAVVAHKQYGEGLYIDKVGNTKYENYFDQKKGSGGDADLASWLQTTKDNSNAYVIGDQLGVIKDSKYMVNGDDNIVIEKVARNYTSGLLENEVYMSMKSGGKSEGVDETLRAFNSLSSGDIERSDYVSGGLQGTVKGRTLDRIFGTNEKTALGQIGKAIKNNPVLADAWNNAGKGDARLRQSIMLAGMEYAAAAPTVVSRDAANRFIHEEAGFSNSVPLEGMAGSLDTGWGNSIASLEEEGTPFQASMELHKLKKASALNMAYVSELNSAATAHKKMWGGVPENMQSVIDDLTDVGSVIDKYASRVREMTAPVAQYRNNYDPLTSERTRYENTNEEIIALGAKYPWMKHGNMKIVSSKGSGSVRTSSLGVSAGADETNYFIVPVDGDGSATGIAVGTHKGTAKKHLERYDDALFETTPNGE